MADRRQSERRQQPLRLGEGRRQGERPHGSRAMYQTGCRCLPCKAANAAYERAFRQAHRTGKPLLGAKMSAVEAWRLIKALKIEGFRNCQLAVAQGLRDPHLQLHPDVITVRSFLRIRQLYRRRVVIDDSQNV